MYVTQMLLANMHISSGGHPQFLKG